jgi:glyoxylase-like metal-dependent hydrolase (beta-lactamase superfamily II)
LLPAGASRFDLPGGDANELRESLARLSGDLASDDVICPGHGRHWASAAAKTWLAGHLESL